MKKCPYCAEEIKEDAIKCRYCGEWLDEIEPVISEPDKIENVVAEVVEDTVKVGKALPMESKEDHSINGKLVFQKGFKDPTGLTKFLRILLTLGIIILIIGIWSSWLQVSLLGNLKKGVYYTIEKAELNDNRQRFIGILQIVLFLITGITFLVWTYRANYNAKKLGAEGMRFSPGWSVGWYFVPIANLWKPYQAMKEIWKANKYQSSDWQSQPSDPILGWWWAFWIISIHNDIINCAIS